jgi:Zn-dependent protease/CBS domain-containing protein
VHGFKSMRVGSIDGIVIRIDWSILVIFWLLMWSLAVSGLPELASGYSAAEYWFAAVVTTMAFFASLLAHELSHCVVARRQGLQVRDVTLWLLGGVSTIEQESQTPAGDLRIAIAGPVMSLAIGVIALVVAATFLATDLPALLVAGVAWLGSVNLLLALFNLVPAAPLDGGRVLRAVRWRQTGDRMRGALDAVRAGRIFAVVLMTLGFTELLFGADISGIWFLLLGWFLLGASRAEEMQIQLTRSLASTRVGDLMTPNPITVRGDMMADDALDRYMLTHHCSTFPVVDVAGRMTGLLTLGRLRSIPSARRSTTPVSAIAWPAEDLTIAAPDDLVLDVLRRAAVGGGGRILVCDEGALVGIVSPSDITRALELADSRRSS